MERIETKLDKIDQKIDTLQGFMAAAPSKFAPKEEFDQFKGAVGMIKWLFGFLGAGGVIAAVYGLIKFLRPF